MTAERLTLSVTEAAQWLGVSRNSAYQGVLAGEIPHIRIGKRIVIPVKALERMLDGLDQPYKNKNCSSEQTFD